MGASSRKRPAEDTWQSVTRRRICAAQRQQQLRQELIEQEQLARWISSRALAPSKGPTAKERLDAIRERLRNRAVQGSDT